MNVMTPQSLPRDFAVLSVIVLPMLACLIFIQKINISVYIPFPITTKNAAIIYAAAILPSFIWGLCVGYVLQMILVKGRWFPIKGFISLLILGVSFYYCAALYNKYERIEERSLLEVGQGYVLLPMDSFPPDGNIQPGQIYLERNNAKLDYILKTYAGNIEEGSIDFQIEQFVTQKLLLKHKDEILDLISEQGKISQTKVYKIRDHLPQVWD